jgi:hypothetical protein
MTQRSFNVDDPLSSASRAATKLNSICLRKTYPSPRLAGTSRFTTPAIYKGQSPASHAS